MRKLELALFEKSLQQDIPDILSDELSSIYLNHGANRFEAKSTRFLRLFHRDEFI